MASRNWPIIWLPATTYCIPDIVVAAGGGAHNPGVLVHGLQELANDEGNGLDPLHLLLGVEVFLLQVALLVLDVLLLHLQELQLLLQLLVPGEIYLVKKLLFGTYGHQCSGSWFFRQSGSRL